MATEGEKNVYYQHYFAEVTQFGMTQQNVAITFGGGKYSIVI